jgi:AcrR family transcriptional regulator
MATAQRPINNLRLRRILEQAARLICRRGFEATSMQEIADTCGLTKAGIYHYVETKQALLVAIMHYGMDLFEEEILQQVTGIPDPVERLRATMARNIRLVESSKEVAIILNEHQTLASAERRALNARKKQYVSFLEATFREAIERRQIRPVDPTVAAFSFLGVILWTPNWYRTGGRIPLPHLIDGMADLFFKGLLLQ